MAVLLIVLLNILLPSSQMREIPGNDAKGILEFSPQLAKAPMDIRFLQDILASKNLGVPAVFPLLSGKRLKTSVDVHEIIT